MKRIIVLIALIISLSSKGQMYVGGGVGMSNSIVGVGTELGVYDDKQWLAFSFDHTPSSHESFVGVKYYRLILGSERVDTYGVGMFKVQTKTHEIAPEPGLAVVYKLSPNWAPQLTVSTPIYQGYVYTSINIGVNYWITLRRKK